MDKHTAHYSLTLVQDLINDDQYRFTRTARYSIRFDLQMRLEDAISVILDLKPTALYKSMTTYHDHSLWQDVYHSQWKDVPPYIKIQIDDEEQVVIISFKPLED